MSIEIESIEDRILALEFLLDAFIWGAHLEDEEHRKKIADHLSMCVEASQRHKAHPESVQKYLMNYAKGLTGSDVPPSNVVPFRRP